MHILKNIIRKLQFTFKPWQLHLLTSLFLLFVYNFAFWVQINQIVISQFLMMVSIFLLLLLIINLLLNLLCGKYSYKLVYALIFIGSSLALYFINQYNIIIDKDMVQNVLETNPAEAGDFFNSSLLMYLIFLGFLPTLLILNFTVEFSSFKNEMIVKLKIFLMSFLCIGLLLYLSYPSYASIARNNRHLSHLIVPTNFVFASVSYFKQRIKSANKPLDKIASDAQLKAFWKDKKNKTVVVLVVGETARADHFSINGYEKLTNPKLSKRNIINFTQVSSCGTSTATSLPCMFSHMSRDDFSKTTAKNTENVLDFLKNTGYSVQWRDNNTGCKGICNRVDLIDLSNNKDNKYCQTHECFDEVLLDNLQQQITNNNNNQFIVLHQKGSHGPAYYLRYPQEFETFTPVCQTNKLQACSIQKVSNAYDNTIIYTDHVVDKTIATLESLPQSYDTALIYISDHGESLGENNIYLHGTPYFMAPNSQTHVPEFIWLSESFKNSFKINENCLKNKRNNELSHDNLFHSILGMMGVQTQYYNKQLDVFDSCRQR